MNIDTQLLSLLLSSLSAILLIIILVKVVPFLKIQSKNDQEHEDDKLNDQLNTIQTLLSTQNDRLSQLANDSATSQAPLEKLNRYLSGGTLAGTFGEWGLKAIVSDILPADKYIENCVTIPGTSNPVEIAIKLTDSTLLPIDAKFPSALYDSYIAASHFSGNDDPKSEKAKKAVRDSRIAIREKVKAEAQKINELYIAEEYTTNFGIMFIPSEGLVQLIDTLKMSDGNTTLREYVSSQHKIIISGPSSLAIYLSSIDMGFRNVAVSNKAQLILEKFLEFDREFNKFVKAKSDVRSQITTISNKLDEEDTRIRVLGKSMDNLRDLSRSDEEETED